MIHPQNPWLECRQGGYLQWLVLVDHQILEVVTGDSIRKTQLK